MSTNANTLACRIRRTLAVAAAASLGSLAVATHPAPAATGAVVENSYFRAYATSACSAGRVDATVRITSKKHNLWVTQKSVGLYGSGGGLLMGGGSSGSWTRSFYAGQSFSWRWVGGGPRNGAQVRFYIDTEFTVVTPVTVACYT